MRQLCRQWSDKKPFTRRLRWYAENYDGKGSVKNTTNIRIQFEDETGKQHVMYGKDVEEAEKDWQAFKSGTLTVQAIIDRKRG